MALKAISARRGVEVDVEMQVDDEQFAILQDAHINRDPVRFATPTVFVITSLGMVTRFITMDEGVFTVEMTLMSQGPKEVDHLDRAEEFLEIAEKDGEGSLSFDLVHAAYHIIQYLRTDQDK